MVKENTSELEVWRIFEILFKLGWIVSLLWFVYSFFWIIFFAVIAPDLFLGKKDALNFGSFIVSNLLSIGLVLIYSKELLVGYFSESKSRIKGSLILIFIIIILILISQYDFYTVLIFEIEEMEGPIAVILISFLGLIMNRLLFLRKLKD